MARFYLVVWKWATRNAADLSIGSSPPIASLPLAKAEFKRVAISEDKEKVRICEWDELYGYRRPADLHEHMCGSLWTVPDGDKEYNDLEFVLTLRVKDFIVGRVFGELDRAVLDVVEVSQGG